eukprot:TRINITY_DN2465_c0_g1_i1.p1 TRINITY_DN2465_c0_g1~~TRINITY_DN2465_c0_g1_i1.p1  ORF type:complete len:1442 (+),score=213.72 TRINITY_DN2465_c0_g1_i1:144-4469(+)
MISDPAKAVSTAERRASVEAELAEDLERSGRCTRGPSSSGHRRASFGPDVQVERHRRGSAGGFGGRPSGEAFGDHCGSLGSLDGGESIGERRNSGVDRAGGGDALKSFQSQYSIALKTQPQQRPTIIEPDAEAEDGTDNGTKDEVFGHRGDQAKAIQGYRRMSHALRQQERMAKMEEEEVEEVAGEMAAIPDPENWEGIPPKPQYYRDNRGYSAVLDERLEERRKAYHFGQRVARVTMFVILVGITALVLVLQYESTTKRGDDWDVGRGNSTWLQIKTDGTAEFWSDEVFKEALRQEAAVTREHVEVYDVFSASVDAPSPAPHPPGDATPIPPATSRAARALEDCWTADGADYQDAEYFAGAEQWHRQPGGMWRRSTAGLQAGGASPPRVVLYVHFRFVNLELSFLGRALARLKSAITRDFTARQRGQLTVSSSHLHAGGVYVVGNLAFGIPTRPPWIRLGTTLAPPQMSMPPTLAPAVTPVPDVEVVPVRDIKCGSRVFDGSRTCEPGLAFDPGTRRCRCAWSKESRAVCHQFACVAPQWRCVEPLTVDNAMAVQGSCGVHLQECQQQCEAKPFCVGVIHDRRRPGVHSCYHRMRDGLGFPPALAQQLQTSTSCVLQGRYVPMQITVDPLPHSELGEWSRVLNVTISGPPRDGDLTLTPSAPGVSFEPESLTFTPNSTTSVTSLEIRFRADELTYAPHESYWTPTPAGTSAPPTPEPGPFPAGVRYNLTHIYTVTAGSARQRGAYRVEVGWALGGVAALQYEAVAPQYLALSIPGAHWLEAVEDQREALKFGLRGKLTLRLNKPLSVAIPVGLQTWQAEAARPPAMLFPTAPSTAVPQTPPPDEPIALDLVNNRSQTVLLAHPSGSVTDGYSRAEYPGTVDANVTVVGTGCAVTFTLLDIDESMDCARAAVEVYAVGAHETGRGELLGTYCGTMLPEPLTEVDGFVVALRGASTSGARDGFYLTFDCEALTPEPTSAPTPAPVSVFDGLVQPRLREPVLPQQRGVVFSPPYQWIEAGATAASFQLYGVQTGIFTIQVASTDDVGVDLPGEVNVTVTEPVLGGGRYNVARNGTARQSSTPPDCAPPQCVAGAAIDGMSAVGDPVAITSYTADLQNGTDSAPFWEVVLDRPYAVTDVVVRNRVDCCTNRFYNITVMLMVGNDLYYRSPVNNSVPWRSRADGGMTGLLPHGPSGPDGGGGAGAPQAVELTFSPLIIADRIRVVKDNGANTVNAILSTLNLLEVEVSSIEKVGEGNVTNAPPAGVYAVGADESLYNIAWAGTVTQSSVQNGCARCGGESTVDHAICSAGQVHSMTNTDPNSPDRTPWIAYKFLTPMPVAKVMMFNRRDCCQHRMQNLHVSVSLEGEKVHTSPDLNPKNSLASPEVLEYDMPTPRLVDLVNISKVNDAATTSVDIALSFSEVEILSYLPVPEDKVAGNARRRPVV